MAWDAIPMFYEGGNRRRFAFPLCHPFRQPLESLEVGFASSVFSDLFDIAVQDLPGIGDGAAEEFFEEIDTDVAAEDEDSEGFRDRRQQIDQRRPVVRSLPDFLIEKAGG
jgi:hypothetical protein